jgi:Ca2+-binding RTX toxin-like protein
MPTYFFETITAAQALTYSAASDTLVFSNPTSSASKTSVIYNAATPTSAATITVTDLVTGRAVTFDTTAGAVGAGTGGIQQEGELTNGAIVFPDGSNLVVGSNSTAPAAPDVVALGSGATKFADGLFGGDGADTLDGSSGNDVIQGNQGNDSLLGGAGKDTIFGGQGDDTIDLGGDATTTNFAQGNKGDDTVTVGAGGLFISSIDGGAGNDSLVGSDTTVAGSGDTINGGLGNDTIHGGTGTDVLLGGGGNDLFTFTTGDSGTTAGSLDQVKDWVSSDTIQFGASTTAESDGTTYIELSAADYTSAKSLADGQINAGTVNFVAVQVGNDVVVFADSAGNNGTSDDAITLVGKTLADISGSNILGH